VGAAVAAADDMFTRAAVMAASRALSVSYFGGVLLLMRMMADHV
jgi:hypothetical protein